MLKKGIVVLNHYAYNPRLDINGVIDAHVRCLNPLVSGGGAYKKRFTP